jgi:hypothetical protein
VCSARVGSKPPQTRAQNYPPDWKYRATPTPPNQAGNPAFTFMSIRAFFAPDTPALRLANRRAGVFCASEIEITPDTHRRMTRRIGNASPPQRLQTRRVIRRSPPSAFGLFLRRTHPPYDGSAVGRVCSARARPHSPQTPPQNYPPDWERLATSTFPNQAGNPASTSISIHAFLRRTHPPYGGPDVGRVCSARARPKSPQTPPQNYPPDWKRRASPNASKPGG